MEPDQSNGAAARATDMPRFSPDPIKGDGNCRVTIEAVAPELDAGRYPVKRVPGERVAVEADVFADGHDMLTAVLRFRHESESAWMEMEMEELGNDRWVGDFEVTELGVYRFTVEGWVDHYKTWRRDLLKRIKAGQDLSIELAIGAEFVEAAASRAHGGKAEKLRAWAKEFSVGTQDTLDARTERALDEEMAELTLQYPDRAHAAVYPRELRVAVDPVLARTSAWYEMFPRSCPGKRGAHGTFQDVEAQLPRVAEMGFDILYLPPIHPIGTAFRKGRNNNPVAEPGEPGSPWGIGSADGGHKAIHPELGSLGDFKHLVARARELKIELALDIAFQCSPDHPWVREHPTWFKQRPDGTIQYAENPPKKYQDIYPLNFDTTDWQALWQELKSVFYYWIAQGVTVFRVDNPHTKSLAFWDWCLGEIRKERPDVIFLAEAFTRPRVMEGLSKMGFNQSYNYFPWRDTKWDIIAYLTELARPPLCEFFRANLWPNTPDILTHHLQEGSRHAFVTRLILAATLGSTYGIYGPAFELMEHKPFKSGGEEYLDSEKYQIRDWDLSQPNNLSGLIARVNRIRRENPALHGIDTLEFHPLENDMLIAYSKTSPDLENVILIVVNLDRHHVQSGWINLQVHHLGMEPNDTYQVHDLLTGAQYQWRGYWNYVQIDPASDVPAHIFRVHRDTNKT